MYFERRKSERAIATAVGYLKREGVNSSEKYVSFFTKNISPDGAKIVIDGWIKPREYLVAVLQLPNFAFPLITQCQVCWLREITAPGYESSGIKEAGVQFLKIEDHGKYKLEKFLATRKLQEKVASEP